MVTSQITSLSTIPLDRPFHSYAVATGIIDGRLSFLLGDAVGTGRVGPVNETKLIIPLFAALSNIQGQSKAPQETAPGVLLVERKTGLEPATPTLARLCSTS